jgi:hypothetical protein
MPRVAESSWSSTKADPIKDSGTQLMPGASAIADTGNSSFKIAAGSAFHNSILISSSPVHAVNPLDAFDLDDQLETGKEAVATKRPRSYRMLYRMRWGSITYRIVMHR